MHEHEQSCCQLYGLALFVLLVLCEQDRIVVLFGSCRRSGGDREMRIKSHGNTSYHCVLTWSSSSRAPQAMSSREASPSSNQNCK